LTLESRAVKKFAALLLFALAACGKRGDPHPPVPVIPKATSDLVVTQRGPRLLLSWSYPALTTAGKSLTGVRRVVLYRYVEELPVSQPGRDWRTLLPGDIDTTQPPAIALFAKIPPIGPMQFTKLRTRVDSIEAASLPEASDGARLTYEDTPPFHTTDGRPVRVYYAVQTEANTATGQPSNLAMIVPLDVPLPPTAVTATAKAEGINLTWEAPAKDIAGSDKPHVAGYNIYRVAAGQSDDDSATPINAAPVPRTSYTDVPAYGSFSYIVRAVAARGIESDASEAASAKFKDLLPPPTPTGLAALVETKAVRLLWDPVESPDLAGYMVYRAEGSGIPLTNVSKSIPLTPAPITAANFRDTGADPGISYFYEVAAVDKSGNESKRAKTDWVLVPKTP
jgi:hypothetical protein